MKPLYFLLGTLLSNSVFGQAGPPPVEKDNRPIERQAAMFTIKTNNAKGLLDSIEIILTTKGFEIENRDDQTQEMIATRKTITGQNGYEKILLWLERDFNNPETNIRIYFLYGIYMKFLAEAGSTKESKYLLRKKKKTSEI